MRVEMTSDAYALLRDYVNPSLARVLKFSSMDKVEESASGMVVKDDKGNEYLDFCGGYGVFNLGHSNPEVVAAVKDQLDRISLSSKIFISKPMVGLAGELARITPGDLKYSFFCNSGTEAVEASIKLARLATGRTRIVGMEGAFHGKTMGSLSVSGRDLYKRPFEPLVPETARVAFGDPGGLRRAVDDSTAAVILEPIQGEGGVIIPPVGFLKSVREICDERGALMIADEVQTGMGRTGAMFAVEHEKVVPDMMTLAKALGGGIMPIGALVGNERVWKALSPYPLIHTSTFGGGALACTAALKTIEIVERDLLAERAKEMGAYLMAGLKGVTEKHPKTVDSVRGKGLMIGVELTKEGFGGTVIPHMIRNGVILAYTLNNQKVLRFEPPLIVEKNHIDRCLEVFDEALYEAEKLGGN